MVTVDKKKCRGCGLCARICHQRSIVLANGNGERVAQIEHALCSTCTQCIAICPQRALSWDHAQPTAYAPDLLPSAAQLEELFKERRTIRRFTQAKIERALVQEIVGCAIYAPTNNYEMRAIVIDDPEIMATLDTIIMRYASWFFNLIYRWRVTFNIAKAITPAVDRRQKVKMEHGLKEGKAFETLPAAIVLLVGDQRIPLSEASAQYALYNMIFYAQAQGIGSRINGGGPLTLNRSRRARRCMGLRRHERLLGMLELGHAAVRFRNKVEGKTMPIAWNGAGAAADGRARLPESDRHTKTKDSSDETLLRDAPRLRGQMESASMAGAVRKERTV